MLSTQEQADLMAGRFRVVCPVMSIVDDSSRLSIAGPGVLSQDSSGQLFFSLENQSHAPDRFALGNQAGRKIGLEQMPVLTAKDEASREWYGEGVRFDGIPIGRSVSGQIGRLRARTARQVGDVQMRLLIPTSINFPSSVWGARDDDFEITFTQCDGGVEVLVMGESIPAELDSRIEEAIWFTFGAIDTAVAVQRTTADADEVVVQKPINHGGGRLHWPIVRPRMTNRSAIAHVFWKYMRYAMEAPLGAFHPTSANLRTVHSALGSTIEEGALVLSVAIEAFVRREHKGKGQAVPAVAAAAREMTSLIEGWKGATEHADENAKRANDQARERVLGCVAAMCQANPRSAINELSENGPLMPVHRKAWARTRHGAVHGDPSRDKSLLLDDTLVLYQALTALILDRIGYTGPMVDLTAEGWSAIAFPFERSPVVVADQ